MDKIGYILLTPHYSKVGTDKTWMENFGCNDIIVEEYPKHGKNRDLWDRLLAKLQSGDTLVVTKLSNVLKSVRQLIFFLEFCRIQNVRLVSIQDKIDSSDEMFPETKTSDVLKVIGMFPIETIEERGSLKSNERMKSKVILHKPTLNKIDRKRKVINMYSEGFSIDDIIAQSRFKSRSSVFRILNDAGVDLNRGRTKGPLGPRKKKENPEEN